MKKIFLSTCLSLFAISAFSQNQDYTISDLEGNQYENNSIHVFNIHGTFADPLEEAKLHLLIENQENEDIYIRAEVVEMVNTDGTMAQFCIGGPSGNCFTPISTGVFYPNTDGGVMYAAANWGMFDYIINLDPTNLAEYKVRFVQTDGAGNELPDTNFYLTYIYDEDAMGVIDVQSKSIAQIYPTVAKGSTTVNLKEDATVQILNVQGRIVRTLNLKQGETKLNLNGLSTGVYWVAFKGVSGTTTNIKVLVK
jgi:hypothetical protein